MKCVNYYVFIWRSFFVVMQDLQFLVGYGWELEDDCLKLVYMMKDFVLCSFIEFIMFNCK